MEVNPLNIFFVKSDSKGDRLLFRYPYRTHVKHEYKQIKYGHNNPYAVTNNEDLLQNTQTQTSNISKGQLSGFTDEMLSTLFAVKAELCNRKFELKVNDVRFVGHPTLLPYRTNKDDSAAMILINIVFALQASASHSIVKCYYDLSKRLGKALRHEEKRCSYLTEEMKIMLAAHDELTVPDADPTNDEDEIDNLRHSVSSTTFSLENGFDNFPKSAFHIILQRSSLARSMKEVFRDLCKSGIVHVQINKWVLLSFCLPHKAHHIHNNGLIIEPETIDKCLRKLRPYHGILLMVNPNELLECIPLDGCPALLRLIKLYSPLKSLQTLAMEAFLTLSQVFQLTGHLVYWAKATVIYPLCEGNVYVVAPGANVDIHSPLVEEFAAEFNGLCLLQVLSAFSLPAPLWYHARGGVGGGADLTRLPRVVAWLLRRRLLLQLHTYVHFISQHWSRDSETKEYYCEKHDIPLNRSNNSSLTSLNQLQLNVPEPVEPRKCLKLHAMNEQDYPTQNNLNQTDFSHTKPIVIESDMNGQYEDVDSANHSFDDNDNEVAALVSGQAQSDLEGKMDESKNHGSSVDSGINGSDTKTTRTLAVISRLEEKSENMDHKDDVKTMTSRLSDVSLKDHGKETSSDEDQFSDTYVSPFNKQSNGLPNQKKKNVPVLRIQTENSNFHSPTMWNGSNNCDGDSFRNIDSTVEENILEAFTVEERLALSDIAYDPEDILLLAQLHKKGYFHGEHHLEEIMFMENVTRSQLMQLLDKFREVLITFETEDLAVAMLYPKH